MILKENNIKKLAGGGIIPAFASYIPMPLGGVGVPTKPAKTNALGEPEDPFLNNALKKLLAEKGLPSDVGAFYSILGEIGTSISADPLASSNISNLMGTVGTYLNKIAFNDREYERSLKIVTENGGLSEAAITSSGRIVCLDEEGKFKMITPTEYKKDSDKYRIMNNGELALLRATDPNMAFNSDIFGIISNGVGMDKINKSLFETITKIGKTASQSDRFLSKKDGKVLDGITEILQEDKSIALDEDDYNLMNSRMSAGKEGVYKETRTTSSENAAEALLYLYSTLPTNERTLLKVKAILSGFDTDKGELKMLELVLKMGTDTSISSSLDYDSSLNPKQSDSSGSSGGMTEVNSWEYFVNNKSTDKREHRFNPGTGVEIALEAKMYSSLPKPDGTFTNLNMLLPDAIDLTVLSTMRSGSVSVGNKLVSDIDQHKVIVLPSRSGVALIFLPYKTDEATGRRYPDLEMAKKIDEVETKIKKEHITSEAGRLAKYKSANLLKYYTPKDAPVEITSVAPFYAIDAAFPESVAEGADGKIAIGVKEYDGDTDDYVEMYNKLAADSKSGAKENDLESWFGINNNIYTGTLYVAASADPVGSAIMGKANIYKPKQDIDLALRRAQSGNNALTGIKTQFKE